ncbi:MAG: hypothetical protein ACK4TC_10255 [Sphingomonas pseudosanguinis]|uniref:hypothetical protein n=1 Tax=Sphingomonas pseudosanguinis TaxID=413712 RepID=UPI00391DB5E4
MTGCDPGYSQRPRLEDIRTDLPLNARLVVREVWSGSGEGAVIVHEQYQRPARWWHPATRLIGIMMIMLAIGWPVILLSYGWTRTATVFAAADIALLATGWEVMKSGEKRWL